MRMKVVLTAVQAALLLALAGCGGGGDDGQSGDSYVALAAPDEGPFPDPVATLPAGFSWFDSDKYWAVSKISDTFYAIYEPNYQQQNVIYLLIGTENSFLFDTGATPRRDITKVVASLTSNHVIAMPSHLHYDHIGGLPRFQDIWLVDVPFTRSLPTTGDGLVTVPTEVHIGDVDPEFAFRIPPFRVSRWVQPGATIDIGGKTLRVIWTPGHEEAEVVVYDETDNILLSGDHMYPCELYVQKTTDYLASATLLLGVINPATRLYGAHCASAGVPAMSYQDAVDVQATLRAIQANEVQGTPIAIPGYVQSGLAYDANQSIALWRFLVFEGGHVFGLE